MRKRKLRIVLNVVLLAILLTLAMPYILTIFSALLAPISVYDLGIAVGGSMYPAIVHGDVLVVKKSVRDIEIGDIIAFKIGFIKCTHRVIEIKKDPILEFKTKGDANEMADGTRITPDKFVGKVVCLIPTSFFVKYHILYPLIFLSLSLILIRAIHSLINRSAPDKILEFPINKKTTVLSLMIIGFSLTWIATLMLSSFL